MRKDHVLTKQFNGAVHLLCTQLEAPYSGTGYDEQQAEVYAWIPYQDGITSHETGAKPVRFCSELKANSLKETLEKSAGTSIFAQSTPAGAKEDYFADMKVAKLIISSKLEML